MTRSTLDCAQDWVLLPGTLCTNRVFDDLLDHLHVAKSNRHLLPIDAPDVRDYAPRLKKTVRGGEIVCGFSLGAMVLAHNLDAIRQARAVVLLASNPFPDPPGNRANREAVRDRILRGGARDWVAENWPVMSAFQSEERKAFVASMAENTSHLIEAQTELAASRPGAEKQLLTTEIPLVFVTGSKDQLTPADPVRKLATAAKNADFNVLDGLGHFALIEAPDSVAAAVQNGLKMVAPIATQKGHIYETRNRSRNAS